MDKAKRARQLAGAGKERSDHDFYATPEWCTRALLDNHDIRGDIWEPPCGDGAMCRVLAQAGHEVLATDLIDRGYGDSPLDFTKFDPEGFCIPNVITNPPFSLALEFVEKALSMTTQTVAMFLKLNFLETAGRWKRLHGRYPRRTLVFTSRPSFGNHKSGMIAFAWFVWQFPFERQTDTIDLTHIW